MTEGHTMKHLGRPTSLLLVLLLLASVGTASAECAWVLWQQISGRYLVNVATTTPDACHAEVKDRVQRAAMLNYKVVTLDPGRGVYVDPKDGYVSFLCLPDTVDPRGPKTR